MPISFSEIAKYWNTNPCEGGCASFPFLMYTKKKVLEIGCGMGADAQRFVTAGAYYTGVDLTDTAINITKGRIGRWGNVKKMNAEYLDFPNNIFDLVYSFGVIHHTIHPRNVINEAYRILKPGGFIFVMLYNKPSWRYSIEIMFLRKILWHMNYYKFHDIKRLIPNPTKAEWVSINTDAIGCPLSYVYSKKTALDLLDRFHITKTWTENYGWFRMLLGQKPQEESL